MDNREKKWPNEATARIGEYLRDPAVYRGIKIWVTTGPSIDGYEAHTMFVRLWTNMEVQIPTQWEEVDWTRIARAINREFNLR